MRCRAIYAIRYIDPVERQLVQETLREWKQGLAASSLQRILPQQLEDGFPTFRHYGIDLCDGTVIHFRGKLRDIHSGAWVQRTSCAQFCRGDVVCEACDVRFRFPPEIVAQRALCQVGSNFGGYHFLWNNCEHFVNWCACGRRISRQVLLRDVMWDFIE